MREPSHLEVFLKRLILIISDNKNGRYYPAFFMPLKDEIADSLRGFFRQKQGRLLGAQVGGFLRSRFPDYDYREHFKSLKEFLEAVMPGEVRVVAKHGPDDVLEMASGVTSHTTDRAEGNQALVEESAWQIFINPTLNGRVIYDRVAHRVYAENEVIVNGLPPMCVNVGRVSHDEQRAIMGEFGTMHAGGESTIAIRESVQSENPTYWRDFFIAVQKAGLLHQWLAFRRDRLRRVFQQKLLAVGVKQEDVADFALQIKKVAPRAEAQTRPVEAKIKSNSSGSLTLHELAQAAVGRLSEQQLRALNIPLGVIWDVLEEHR